MRQAAMGTMGPESRCPTEAVLLNTAAACLLPSRTLAPHDILIRQLYNMDVYLALCSSHAAPKSNQAMPHNQRLLCHSLPQLPCGPGHAHSCAAIATEFAWCRDVCCYCKRRWQAMPQHGWDRGRLLQREGEAREGRGDKMVSSQASVGLKQE